MTTGSGEGFLMKELLEPSVRLALERRPQARLVRIAGFGLRENGRIVPMAPRNWVCRWEFAFCSAAEEPGLFSYHSVSYLQWNKPQYSDVAGNVSETEPFDDETLAGIADSDELVEIFASISGFRPMAGHDDDFVAITMRRPLDPVAYMHNRHGQWAMIDPLGREVIKAL
ncbi:MAG: hypothetical protein D6806_07680 [Deltaproteobacteria bacterium]|nr:MAG: hypothetical protein D6806_07680 [Deltaproteobacteria bacterium]